MSLESALQETKQRFQEEQAKKAREDEERRGFVKRVVIALRAPGAAAVETMEELQRMLSEAASVHIEALRRSYPNMDRLILAPNVSTYSSLGGHVLVLGPDQVITQMSHVVNVKSPFALTMATRLRNATYTSAKEYRDKYAARINEYVRSLSQTGPAVATHMGKGEDAQRWNVFFPTKCAHVGVYNTSTGDIYLVVRSHAGPEVLPGVRAVVDEVGTTARSFVDDPRVKWMQNMAYRNAARLTHGIARFLGFETPSTYDFESHSGERRLARYAVARPDIVQFHDTQRITERWGAPRAAFFRDVIDGGQGTGDKVLIQTDITKGYAMIDTQSSTESIFPLTTDKIPFDERPVLSVDQRDQVTEKISSLMPRRHMLTHHKYRDASRGVSLYPVVVVRS